jgi:hypothetical protein
VPPDLYPHIHAAFRVTHHLLDMMVSKEFYGKYVKLPAEDSPIPHEIRSNPKFFLFFED